MRQKRVLLIGLIVLLSNFIFLYTFFPKENIDEVYDENLNSLKSAKVWSGSFTLYYDKYWSFSEYSQDLIEWSITGSLTNIDVIVMIMSSADYSRFLNEVFLGNLTLIVNNGNYTILSDGISDGSGSYYPPFPDTWYFILVNIDSDEISTFIKWEVKWDSGSNSFFRNFTGFPLIFIGIISTIIFIGICGAIYSSRNNNKKKLNKPNKNPYIINSEEPMHPTGRSISLMQKQDSSKNNKIEQFYCMFCGEELNQFSKFCPTCGTKLEVRK